MSSSVLSMASTSGSLLGAQLPHANGEKVRPGVRVQHGMRMVVVASQAGSEGGSSSSNSVSRRDALLLASSAAAASLISSFPTPALALGAPKGYAAREDGQDRYRFFYPFGWQEVVVKGQDVVFKDVIEPLENVAVNVINTEKTSITELGSATDVAQLLVDKVLTGPAQQAKLVKAEEKENAGKVYYTFEFVAAAPSYKRHALGVVSVANGKLYTLTTGSNERRWRVMEEKLKAVVNSFEAI